MLKQVKDFYTLYPISYTRIKVFKILFLVFFFFILWSSVFSLNYAFADNIVSIGSGTIDVGTAETVIISNISISRYGDVPGSGIIVAWDANPAGPIDIWTRTGSFTTDASLWIKEKPNVSTSQSTKQGSWTDVNQVGQGTQKYYKMMPAGANLTTGDLTSEVVGKFDKALPAGPSDSLVSIPLLPPSIDINSVIGNQLTGGIYGTADKIYQLNGTSWNQCYLKTDGSWQGPLTGFEADKGYYIRIESGHPAKMITFVGNVSTANRTLALVQGDNLIGTSFPMSISINSSNLSEKLTKGIYADADKIYYWDGSSWIQCYLGVDGTFSGPLTTFEPGNAYYIANQILLNSPNPDLWIYNKPY